MTTADYFDAIGMLPARRLAPNFPDGRWDAPKIGSLSRQLAAGDASTFARLIAGRPKLWILNYRFGPLWPQLEAFCATPTFGSAR